MLMRLVLFFFFVSPNFKYQNKPLLLAGKYVHDDDDSDQVTVEVSCFFFFGPNHIHHGLSVSRKCLNLQ